MKRAIVAVMLTTLVVGGGAPASADVVRGDTARTRFPSTTGRFSTFDVPGAAITLPFSINEREQVAGVYLDPGATPNAADDSPWHGFVRDKRGRITTIDVPGAWATLVLGLNNRGQVAGYYLDADAVPTADGVYPRGTVHGFLWEDGVFTTRDVRGAGGTGLADINDRGMVVGNYGEPGKIDFHGFMQHKRRRLTTIDVPGAPGTEAVDGNNRGQIVGAYGDPCGIHICGARPFLRSRTGRITRIDLPGAAQTGVGGINDLGVIAGSYTGTDGVSHGYLRDAKGRITRIDVPGASSTLASESTSSGLIVGGYVDADGGVHGFLLRPDTRR